MRNKIMEDRRFKRMPTLDELAKMERDLRFHPVDTESPKKLTRAQIESFNREGYLKGIEAFDDEEISGIRKEFDALLAQALASGQTSYSIISAHLKCGMVHDIMKNPRIVSYVQDILGEDIIGWGSQFFCKLPHDRKIVAWHQDASYWPLSPSKTVTAWLAIDDADTENACMRFIAGSHTFGHINYRPSEDQERNVLNQTVDGVSEYGAPVDIELKAGQISLHSDLLLHSSGPNRTNRRRCGLTIRYCAASVRSQIGWNAEGVQVSGLDTSGHWADSPRPAVDMV